MNIINRIKRIWQTLPTLYSLQPTPDYQSLISHSARDIEIKAWARTGHVLRGNDAREFERRMNNIQPLPKEVQERMQKNFRNITIVTPEHTLMAVSKEYLDLATKRDLEAFEADLIKWMAGLLLAQTAIVATLVKLL